IFDHLLRDCAPSSRKTALLDVVDQRIPRHFEVYCTVLEKGIVFRGHHGADDYIRDCRNRCPNPELLLVIVGQNVPILIEHFRSSCRSVMFEHRRIGEISKNDKKPEKSKDDKEKRK